MVGPAPKSPSSLGTETVTVDWEGPWQGALATQLHSSGFEQ